MVNGSGLENGLYLVGEWQGARQSGGKDADNIPRDEWPYYANVKVGGITPLGVRIDSTAWHAGGFAGLSVSDRVLVGVEARTFGREISFVAYTATCLDVGIPRSAAHGTPTRVPPDASVKQPGA